MIEIIPIDRYGELLDKATRLGFNATTYAKITDLLYEAYKLGKRDTAMSARENLLNMVDEIDHHLRS